MALQIFAASGVRQAFWPQLSVFEQFEPHSRPQKLEKELCPVSVFPFVVLGEGGKKRRAELAQKSKMEATHGSSNG